MGDINLLWLAIGPVLIPLLAKLFFPHKISWIELLLNIIVVLALTAGIYSIAKHNNISDVEVINGQITEKTFSTYTCTRNMPSAGCRHSYSCNCRTVRYTSTCYRNGKSYTCTKTKRVCDTCYRYPWERDYYLQSDIGRFSVPRQDPQGATEPLRWVRTEIGEPASRHNSYTNWIKASADSLFKEHKGLLEQFKDLPDYPNKIYDIYKIDRVILLGNINFNTEFLNKELSEILKILGPQKQANIIIVITDNPDDSIAYALRAKWDGFKKNDIVINIGVDESNVVQWTKVFSWSKNEMVNIVLEDEIYKHFSKKPIESNYLILTIFHNVTQYFERRSMKEFEYLTQDAVMVPTYLWATLILLSIFGTIGLSYVFYKIEIGDKK